MDRDKMIQDIVHMLRRVSDRHLTMIHRIIKKLAS